jgi:hypothetical protein
MEKKVLNQMGTDLCSSASTLESFLTLLNILAPPPEDRISPEIETLILITGFTKDQV